MQQHPIGLQATAAARNPHAPAVASSASDAPNEGLNILLPSSTPQSFKRMRRANIVRFEETKKPVIWGGLFNELWDNVFAFGTSTEFSKVRLLNLSR